MQKFRVKNLVPPGGRYFYEEPTTGVRLESPTKSGLTAEIQAHCRTNQLAVPKNLSDLIEDFMCERLPEGFCYGTGPRAKVITLQQVKKRTSDLAAGNPRLTSGEARQRAAACGDCELNDRSACPTCVGLVSWSSRLAGNSIGGMGDWLGVCAVDSVALPTKIFLKNVPENDEYPTGCWRHASEQQPE